MNDQNFDFAMTCAATAIYNFWLTPEEISLFVTVHFGKPMPLQVAEKTLEKILKLDHAARIRLRETVRHRMG